MFPTEIAIAKESPKDLWVTHGVFGERVVVCSGQVFANQTFHSDNPDQWIGVNLKVSHDILHREKVLKSAFSPFLFCNLNEPDESFYKTLDEIKALPDFFQGKKEAISLLENFDRLRHPPLPPQKGKWWCCCGGGS